MKIKKEFYCITDKNNRPDFRFLFENPTDAQKKIKKIKNSIQGETLFLSQNKKDFFPNGIQKHFISKTKKIAIRPGCWTSLSVKKVRLTENFLPTTIFQEKVAHAKTSLSFEKKLESSNLLSQKTNTLLEKLKKEQEKCSQKQSFWNKFWSFRLENSFLKNRVFLSATAVAFVLVIGLSTFYSQEMEKQITSSIVATQNDSMKKITQNQVRVLGEKTEKETSAFDENFSGFILETLLAFNQLQQEEFEKELQKIVQGSPMEKMVPLIAKQDRKVAAFLIGIAKKESNFGRRVPVLNGQDCFNYWGYRGIRPRMGTGGHTCFDSPEDAVQTVASRIEELVEANINTPSEMVIWKCGSSCEKHSLESVRKWISDVNIYYQEIMEGEKS